MTGTMSGMGDGLYCKRDGCDKAVLPIEEPGWDKPPLTRAEREAKGLRTECIQHFKQSRGIESELIMHPGQGFTVRS